MNPAASHRPIWIIAALSLFLFVMLSGCQDEKNQTPQPGSTTMVKNTQPAADQSAPIPENQKLELLRFGPSGQVEKLNQVVAMFNQPMVALGDFQNVPAEAMVITPPQAGDLVWINQYSLAFIPKEPLTGSLDLTARLNPAALKALSGAAMTEAKEISINLTDLKVADTSQLNAEPLDLDQALKPQWQVTFNQMPDVGSLEDKAAFVYKDIKDQTQTVSVLVEKDPEYLNATFILTAKRELPSNTPYRLEVAEGLKSLAGPKLAPEMVVAAGATFGPLDITIEETAGPMSDPGNSLIIQFSNPMDLTKLVPLISLDNGYDLGPLRAQYPQDSNKDTENVNNLSYDLYIPGGFKANTEYSLTVAKEAKDIFGQSLGQDLSLKFTTGQHYTFVDLGNDYGLLETLPPPQLRLIASNIDQAKVTGYALTAEQAIKLLTISNFSPKYYGDLEEAEKALASIPSVEKTIQIPNGAKNGRVALPLELADIFGDQYLGRFLYLRTNWSTKNNNQEETKHHSFAMAQVSDIGLAVKVGTSSALVWTTNLGQGQSWPGVELEMRDATGQLIWSGQSDENGLANLPGSVEIKAKLKDENFNVFIVAKAEKQMALWNINWDNGLETWRWNVDYRNAMGNEPDDSHWLLNALPIYKPGETAKFKIIARTNDNVDQLQNWPQEPVDVEIYNPLGEVVERVTLPVSPYGTISHQLALPANATLGYWSVMVGRKDSKNLGYAGTFTVMAFRAPAFEIKIDDQPKTVLAGDKVEIKIKADYHFGAPVNRQPAHYSVLASPADFKLPGNFSNYSIINHFTPAEDTEDMEDAEIEPSRTVASDETNLDKEGRLTCPVDLSLADNQRPLPRTYQAYFTVTDVDLRTVSTSTDFLVHPAELYAGLHSDKFIAETGQPYVLKVIAADLQGALVPEKKIKVTVFHRVWQNVRRKTAGAAYEYISRMVDEKISTQELVSDKMPIELTLNPEKPGYYWVLAEVADDKGRTNQASYDFYASGGGPVGWIMGNDDSLTLVTDKQEYQPGETARIMVQSPFSQGEGLMTVERAGIRHSQVFKIENQTPVLEVPLTDDDSPNVFISVLLTRGRIANKLDEKGLDFGKPVVKMGYAKLKIPTKKNLLQVAVTPDVTKVGPGDEVEVTVAVTDQAGQPFQEAEVALIAADAAVIQLGGDGFYHPEEQYHRDLPLMVQTADNLVSLIGRQTFDLKGGNPGGGGGDNEMSAPYNSQSDFRRNFSSLAWFEPQVKLNEQGQAKVKIKMPENLTTFRIFAVATGHGRLTGTGENAVLVTRDLLARSALPGYAGVGDEFQAAMVVSNRGEKSGQATVTLAGDNFTLLEDAAEKTVTLVPGQSQEVSFKVKAGAAAEAKFRFAVAMDSDQDAAEFVIPVTPANQLITQASYERLMPGEWRTDLALPEGLDLTRGGLELTLSPSLVGALTEPFDWLKAYPHGCIEQNVSKGYGNLIWLQLKDRFKDDPERETQTRKDIQRLLTKLHSWELDGGYNYWPETYSWHNRSVYLSAYVLDFLLEAKEAGFEIPNQDTIERMTSFLKGTLSSDYKNWPTWHSEKAISEAKSYALAVLSRAGENVAAYVEVNYKNRENLNLFELINLIRAINFQTQSASKAEQIKELLPLLDKHIQVTAGEIQLVEPQDLTPEIWSSSIRTSSMALVALCETAPRHDFIPGLVRWLVSASRSGHFGTTQNNAVALSALAKYVKIGEPGKPNLNLTARLGDKTVAEAKFKSFSDQPVSSTMPWSAIDPQNKTMVYNLEGQGQAWAALKTKSALEAPDLAPMTSGGFMLSRSFAVIVDNKETPGVDRFQRGDLVRVSITLMVPAPRHNLVLTDRVPAGFEPINFNLGDADLSLASLANNSENDGKPSNWYNHQEIWPDRVAVYAEKLDAGVYTFSYLARAITSGTYLTPGPQAEEMYAPETFGRGPGQTLTVGE